MKNAGGESNLPSLSIMHSMTLRQRSARKWAGIQSSRHGSNKTKYLNLSSPVFDEAENRMHTIKAIYSSNIRRAGE